MTTTRAGAGRQAAARWTAVLALTATAAAGQETAEWRPEVSLGHDVYVHSYYLASDDTTATVRETNLTAAIDGRSRRQTDHQWYLRAELSGGSELFRESLDAGYRWRPSAGDPRLGLDLTWLGRQYRETSEYSLTSDNTEGRLELRAFPWLGRRTALDLRAIARRVDYRTPSTLEQDYDDESVAGYLASRGDPAGSWRLGLRAAQRAYPDSAAIDRDGYAVEGELDRAGSAGDIWLFHRSERRLIADESVRPSAWSHWTEARTALAAGAGHVVLDLTSEVWTYDAPTETWFDSWRADLEAGYRWGDLLGGLWHALVTIENLAAGDSPETYTQVGLRGSLESYARTLSGIIALEYGRRWYHHVAPVSADDLDVLVDYSDFNYLEIWVMATWAFADRLALDLTANYQPESHTEQDDDTALGYANVRLVWRP